MAVEGEVG